MFRILLVLISLAVSAPAFAQSEAERAAREVNLAVEAVAEQSRRYEQITDEGLALIGDFMSHLESGLELGERKASQADADRWAAGWIPQTRQRLLELETRLRALPPIDTSGFDRIAGPSDPAARQVARMAATIRPSTMQNLAAVSDLFESVAKYAPAAATGDETAMLRLGVATLESTQTMLEVESATLQRSLSAVGEEHPQYWLMKSNIATNAAMAELFAAAVNEATDPDFKPKAHAQKVSDLVSEARQSARRMPRQAQVMARDSLPAEFRSTELGQKLVAMLATYEASAEIEAQICDRIMEMQRALDRRGTILSEIGPGMTKIEPLAEQRMRLDAGRREVAGR